MLDQAELAALATAYWDAIRATVDMTTSTAWSVVDDMVVHGSENAPALVQALAEQARSAAEMEWLASEPLGDLLHLQPHWAAAGVARLAESSDALATALGLVDKDRLPEEARRALLSGPD